MNNDYLNTFLTVVNKGSFSKAEECLFLSKQAIMCRINYLEQEIGVKLLERSRKGVLLTEAGEIFYRGIQPILEEEFSLIRKVRKTAGVKQGIRLCQIDYHVLLSPVTAAFRQIHPEIEIQYVFHPETKEGKLVMHGIIDIGDTLYAPWYDREDLCYEKLLDMPYFCIFPPSITSFPRDRVSFQELLDYPVVVDAREFSDYYSFHMEEIQKRLPRLEIADGPMRRIEVIYAALHEGKTVITASTFAKNIPGFRTATLETDLCQNSGIVYAAPAREEIMDYVLLAKKMYAKRTRPYFRIPL